MKKFFNMLLVAMLMVSSVNAQIHLFLEEQEIELEDSRSSAWVFPVARDLDEALGDLKDFCKERSDVKMKKEGDNVMIGKKVSVPSIATKRGDLIGYAFITENYYGMAMVFQLGYDISVSSKDWNAEMGNFRNYARAFMAYHYEQSYARRVKDLEKEVKSLKKQKGQNEKKIGTLNNKIENLNKKIGKETDETKITMYKADITTLDADLTALSYSLPLLQNQINELQRNVDKFKAESHTFQSTIGSI